MSIELDDTDQLITNYKKNSNTFCIFSKKQKLFFPSSDINGNIITVTTNLVSKLKNSNDILFLSVKN